MDGRDLPEGVIDAEPPGGWSGVDDSETSERDAAAAEPSDPIESDEPGTGVDPDLSTGEGS